MKAQKALIRRATAHLLRACSPAAVASASERVYHHLTSLDAFRTAANIAMYLSMPSGEVQTHAILATALDAGKTVWLPRVTGPSFSDMRMLHAVSAAEAATYPRSAWAIPEPPLEYTGYSCAHEDAAIVYSHSSGPGVACKLPIALGSPRASVDAVDVPLDMILVPGVAFDMHGGRVGHGKGYYDYFLRTTLERHAQRGWKSPLIVGLAMVEQVLSGPDCMLARALAARNESGDAATHIPAAEVAALAAHAPMSDMDVYLNALATPDGVHVFREA